MWKLLIIAMVAGNPTVKDWRLMPSESVCHAQEATFSEARHEASIFTSCVRLNIPACEGDQRHLRGRCINQTESGAYICDRNGCERWGG